LLLNNNDSFERPTHSLGWPFLLCGDQVFSS
jgi:hypothetical protein